MEDKAIRITPDWIKQLHKERIAKLRADINLPDYYFDDMFFQDYYEYLLKQNKWQH